MFLFQVPFCVHHSRLCDNQTVCAEPTKLCNSYANCMDKSDEGERCSEQLCSHSSHDCSHVCHNAPEGAVCSCPPDSGLTMSSNSKTFANISHPCEQYTWKTCSLICKAIKAKHNCECYPGYSLQNDRIICQNNDSVSTFIILSNRHELRSIDLHANNAKALISS